MKRTKTVTIRATPETTKQVDDDPLCDLCGRVIQEPSLYDVLEVEVKLREGASYPEGGDIDETTFDLCSDCFRTKLIPWMESQGAKPTATNKDW